MRSTSTQLLSPVPISMKSKGGNGGPGGGRIVAAFTAITALSTTLILLLNLTYPDLLPQSLASVPWPALESACSPSNATTTTTLPPDGSASSPFRTLGCAVHSLVVTAAYRSGPASWVVLGLGPNHIYNARSAYKTGFRCVWVAAGSAEWAVAESVRWDTPGASFRPGAYITLVIACHFRPGTQLIGGALVLQAAQTGPRGVVAPSWTGPAPADAWMARELRTFHSTMQGSSGAAHQDSQAPESAIVAVTERAQDYDERRFAPPFAYDDLYCGSPLYGNLSVLAVSEWLSYHFHLFGNKSRFVLHDAGAVSGNPEMHKALQPWVALGIVEVTDVHDLLALDTFYYNQNLLLNDCLHKHSFTAQRLWFFDVDEYIVFRPPHTLQSVVQAHPNTDALQFEQVKFSDKLCRLPSGRQPSDARSGFDAATFQPWNAETLFFRKPPEAAMERKYVLLNPRKILSTGIHSPIQPRGGFRSKLLGQDTGVYYHYHDTIAKRKSQLCGLWLPENATHGQAPTTGASSATKLGVLYDWEYDDAILPAVADARTFIRTFWSQRGMASLV